MNDHVRSEDLAAYVDGRLDTARKSELEKHFSCCPKCLDELADLAVIMGNRDRIPAHFLNQAHGEKNKPAPAPLRLRWVFEVAAAVMVVVFIGYFFLSNNRFWQPSERQMPADAMKGKAGATDFRAAERFKEPAAPEVLADETAESDHMADGSQAPKKEARAPINKDISVTPVQALSADKEKGAAPQIAPAMPQPAVEAKSVPKPEMQQVELKSKGQDSARLETAARGRPSAQTMDMKMVQAQQNQQQQKQAAGSAQTTEPEKKLDKALSRNALAEELAAFPVRIEGDVAWSNLQNPEQIFSWSWFPKDLALELQIDGAGTVTAVMASGGKADERLAAQATSEAKKLIFAISEKKSRRARLVAKDAPPDSAVEDSSLK